MFAIIIMTAGKYTISPSIRTRFIQDRRLYSTAITRPIILRLMLFLGRSQIRKITVLLQTILFL